MSDIVKRLRAMAEADYYGRDQPHFVPPEDCADEIERLEELIANVPELVARAEKAEAALRQIAEPYSEHGWEKSPVDMREIAFAALKEQGQ